MKLVVQLTFDGESLLALLPLLDATHDDALFGAGAL